MTDSRIEFLTELETIIANRAAADVAESYTAELVAAGAKRVAQKVGEESVEVALAAVADDRSELLEEAADLVYHLLVLLQVRECSLADVAAVLRSRHSN